MKFWNCAWLIVGFVCFITSPLSAGDWTRFRGPNGQGIYEGTEALPVEWSDQDNLKWKCPLPGYGLSSPIVVQDKVFVTCWSGYANGKDVGSIDQLKRHLVCVNRLTGKIEWDKSYAAVLPEETFQGMFAENGYASHTPVTDGEYVFAFFGKSGIYAFDMTGKELWHHSVGTEDDSHGWGTASSPIIYKDTVIVPATIESKTMFAFDKKTGKEKWKSESSGFANCWGTPVIVDVTPERTDLVMAVAFEIWGFNPETGKLRWYCKAVDTDSMCSSVAVHGTDIFSIDGRNGGAVAIKAGGKGDVTASNILWTGSQQGRIGTPVYYEGKIFWVTRGILNAVDAITGKTLVQKRIDRSASNATPAAGGGGGGGRRGGGGQDYSSLVLGDQGKFYYTFRNGDVAVMQVRSEVEQLAVNRFASDDSDFNATPALVDGHIFIRSNKALYCIGK
jgi:hypothetical protein